MNTRKILSFLLLVFGEALIITCFVHFFKNADSRIITLNIGVASIIYFLIFIETIFPWIDFNDKTQKTVGAIGIIMFFGIIYIVCAVAGMIVMNVAEMHIQFINQLIVQGGLFFFLILGVLMSYISSDKVSEVYVSEKRDRSGIDEMKKVTKNVQLKLDELKNVPIQIISELNNLQDNIRFLSPSDNQDAFELENRYIEEMKKMDSYIYYSPIDYEKVSEIIENCNRLYKVRKQTFSN